MSSEMDAYVIDEFGGPDAFERRRVAVPDPGPEEVRVEVAASSVNPVDYKIRGGHIPDFAPAIPATLGCDVASVGFDVVFDPVGDDHLNTAFEAARPYGSVVTTESSDADGVDLSPMYETSLSLGVVLVIYPVLAGEGQERIGREL